MQRTIGIEREAFIVNPGGRVVPMIGALLPQVWKRARALNLSKDLFTYELFGGQIEDRTTPVGSLEELATALAVNKEVMDSAAASLNLSLDYSEFISESRIASLQVNPFNSRHQQIWREIPQHRQVAASVVAAVHVHLGVNEQEAVQILNRCREDVVESLVCLGDHSGLQRITAYRTMAEINGTPPMFSSFSEVMDYIASKGGEKNVWDLVRYKPSTKTVEFRMFGTTESVEEVIGYTRACLELTS